MEVLRLFQSSDGARGEAYSFYPQTEDRTAQGLAYQQSLASYKDLMARPARPMLETDVMPQDPAEPVQRCYYSRYKGWVVIERPRPVLMEDL